MSDIYDDPEINTAEDDFPDQVKFNVPGDHVRARVVRIEKITTKFGPTLKYTLLTDQGQEKSMLAGSKNLKAAMLEQRPRQGDVIDLTYTELRPTQSGGDVKIFSLIVESAQAPPLPPPPAPQPAPVPSQPPAQPVAQRAPDPGRAPAPRAVQTMEDERDIFDE